MRQSVALAYTPFLLTRIWQLLYRVTCHAPSPTLLFAGGGQNVLLLHSEESKTDAGCVSTVILNEQ